MADDKTVSKKTAAKKSAATKAATPVAASKALAAPAKKTAPPAAAAPVAPAAKPAVKKTTTQNKTTAGAARAAHRDNPGGLKRLATVTPEQRQHMIQEAAFYKAEKRQFAPGHEQQDWADAEREIDELIDRAKVMTST